MEFLRDYGQDKEAVKQFLKDFTYIDEQGEQIHKYAQMLTKLANRQEKLMTVELADLERINNDLAKQVYNNTVRYSKIFHEATDELLPLYKTREGADKDIMDVFIEQRLFILERNRGSLPNRPLNPGSEGMPGQNRDIDGEYPPELIRRAEVAFKPSSLQCIPIREVLAKHIGKLVTVRGIVTRVTDVKSKVRVVCYTCDQCGCESFQPVQGCEFTPLFECTSGFCKANKTLGRLTMQVRGSKFVKFQEIKLQEHADQVPVGHIPRMITIMAHGEQTRQCAPGDHVSVSGIFLTIEKSSYRRRTGGLSAETYIESQYITQMNKTDDDEMDNEPMSMAEAEQLVRGKTPGFLDYLSGSIAPEIFGHRDLKKALLLLLVGGVDRAPDGMKVRGSINICLMGDPGVAKSQMLGFIDRLAPRSQYTTGRGSSGVGLTAAVLKDPITNELSLEGGALVLADQGICCIDEFDKMTDADRTAIHEVMEQQTVSIAKAGIMTTLNARVSILAAANPAYGRYDTSRKIQDNLQLPPALLSRFDLLWLIKDKPNYHSDIDLAEHITSIHTNPLEQRSFQNVLSMKDMRRYIGLCKKKNPVIPIHLEDKLIEIYLSIRSRKRTCLKETEGDSLFTSPRSLLAIIRMSTALARLRLSEEVEEADIDEAVRLYKCSRQSIEGEDAGESLLVRVSEILKGLCAGGCACPTTTFMEEASGLASSEELQKALDDLEKIEAISREGDGILLF